MTTLYSKSILIDQAKVAAFAELTGDRNPIHLDADYAATTRFKRPIAHGMLVASFISPCLVEAFGEGTIYVAQNLRFVQPVYVGSTILIEFSDVTAIPDKPTHSVVTKIWLLEGDERVGEVVIGQAVIIQGNRV